MDIYAVNVVLLWIDANKALRVFVEVVSKKHPFRQ